MMRRIPFFLLAVMLASVLGALVQTHVNLAVLQDLGVPLPLDVRVNSYRHDLLGFTPLYGVLVLVAFACALPVAAGLARRWDKGRWLLFAGAGACGLWLAFTLVNALAPPPTLIAANRSLGGTLGLLAGGSLGALLYAWLTLPAPAPVSDS